MCIFTLSLRIKGASLVAQTIKSLPVMQETRVRPLGWEDPPEKEMATHSSTLAWKIPWTERLRLQSIRSQRVRHDWATSLYFSLKIQGFLRRLLDGGVKESAGRNQTNGHGMDQSGRFWNPSWRTHQNWQQILSKSKQWACSYWTRLPSYSEIFGIELYF